MRNIEIKATLTDPDAVKTRAKELSGSDGTIIKQKDTFYRVSQGRLKLREFTNNTGELIYYERPDTAGPKLSDYIRTEFNDKSACEGIDKILKKIHGYVGIVEKTRLLFLVGQSRVHIDDVAGLGNFVEIEVVLTDDQDLQTGENISNELMAKLGIKSSDLISRAYIDMLQDKQ